MTTWVLSVKTKVSCYYCVSVWISNARFYELGLTRELTNPRVGVIPSLFSD